MLRGVIRKCFWLNCLSVGVGRFVGHVEQRGVVDAVGCCWVVLGVGGAVGVVDVASVLTISVCSTSCLFF